MPPAQAADDVGISNSTARPRVLYRRDALLLPSRMECACGLFAPTYSQQKPVYDPASQSSMKLGGAAGLSCAHGKSAAAYRRWLYLSSAGRSRIQRLADRWRERNTASRLIPIRLN